MYAVQLKSAFHAAVYVLIVCGGVRKKKKKNERTYIEHVIRHNDEIALRFVSERDFMINSQRSTWIARALPMLINV
jgi:hypothetical protein